MKNNKFINIFGSFLNSLNLSLGSKAVENLEPIETVKEKKILTEEEQYFYDEFKQFLNVGDCVFCFKMLENGFEPTTEDKEYLYKETLNKLNKGKYSFNDIKDLKLLDKNIKIMALKKYIEKKEGIFEENESLSDKNEAILKFFSHKDGNKDFSNYISLYFNNLKVYYEDGLDSDMNFCKKSIYENKRKQEDIYLLTIITNTLAANKILSFETLKEIKEQLVNTVEFITSKTRKSYIKPSFSNIGMLGINNFIELVNRFQFNLLNNQNTKGDLLNKIKFYRSNANSLTEKIKILVNETDYSITNLPIQAISILDRIEDFLKDPKVIDQETKDFINQNLPTILKKYFSVDVEYRDTLKNIQGFNAEQLMIKSLEGLETIVYANKKENNQSALTDLSIEARRFKVA